MCAGPWRHCVLAHHNEPCFTQLPPCTAGQRSQTLHCHLPLHWLATFTGKVKQKEKQLRLFARQTLWALSAKAHSSCFSVHKTSKVTSYYLLPRLIVANEIPNALIEQVCNLLPNEVVFSHKQTKTKQQRGRYIKGGFGQMGHMLSIESRVHQDHSARSIKLAGCLNTWQ